MMLQPQINSARIAPMETMQRVGVILLSNGGFTIVDPERVEEFSKFKWNLSPRGYVTRSKPGAARHIYLHREVMGATSTDPDVDHRFCDKLDNRHDSLRFATVSQNGANAQKQSGCSSVYKGVSWDKRGNNWHVMIRVNYKYINLGSFASEVDGAKAYNAAAQKHFGDFARLNEIP